MRKRTAGSFPFVFFCAVAFCPPLWYGEAEENTEKGRDILGKTTSLYDGNAGKEFSGQGALRRTKIIRIGNLRRGAEPYQ